MTNYKGRKPKEVILRYLRIYRKYATLFQLSYTTGLSKSTIVAYCKESKIHKSRRFNEEERQIILNHYKLKSDREISGTLSLLGYDRTANSIASFRKLNQLTKSKELYDSIHRKVGGRNRKETWLKIAKTKKEAAIKIKIEYDDLITEKIELQQFVDQFYEEKKLIPGLTETWDIKLAKAKIKELTKQIKDLEVQHFKTIPQRSNNRYLKDEMQFTY